MAADQPTPPAPLEELLARVRSGDRAAFAEVYDATASHAFGIAVSVTRDRTLAADVVQEAYLGIWRESASFDATRGSGSGWVSRMVHSVAVNSARSQQSHPNGEENTQLTRVAETARVTTDGERVRTALSQVPAPQRTAVELAYFGGYTHTQIANMTGVPADSATSRIREGLLELLEAMGADPGDAPAVSPS